LFVFFFLALANSILSFAPPSTSLGRKGSDLAARFYLLMLILGRAELCP